MASANGKLWWPKKTGVTGLPDLARAGSHHATLSHVWVSKPKHFTFSNAIHLVDCSHMQKQMQAYTYAIDVHSLKLFFLDTFESIPALSQIYPPPYTARLSLDLQN